MKLVWRDLTSLNSQFLGPWWQEYFELIEYDPDTVYNPREHCFYADFRYLDWVQPFRDAGFRVIIDHLFDSYVDQPSTVEKNTLTLCAEDWLWIHESVHFCHLGYHRHQPVPVQDRFFLMLMNLQKQFRNQLYKAATPYLGDSIYSYQGQGVDINAEDVSKDHGEWQRYFNPEWYNRTAFSLAVESTVTPRLWISEKTFKPIAHAHPFIVVGSPGLLKFIKSRGFETFGHIINESYDSINYFNLRLHAILTEVDRLHRIYLNGESLFADARSKDIVRHNFDRFYNQQLVRDMFISQIVNPIEEFLCTN